jgi:hypothetical protein
VEVFLKPAGDAEPGDADRIAGPIFDGPVAGELAFDVPDDMYRFMDRDVADAIDRRHTVSLVLKVSRGVGAFGAETPVLQTKWETNLRSVTIDTIACHEQCEDADPFIDIQDDEVDLRFHVDGVPARADEYTMTTRFNNMDVGSHKHLPNLAKNQVWNAAAARWDDWSDPTNEMKFYKNLRGLTFNFIDYVTMDFWGIDMGGFPDPDDHLLDNCRTDTSWYPWAGYPEGERCSQEEWEAQGNLCPEPRSFGAASECGGDCEDADAYTFSGTRSRSSAMQ